MKNVLIIGASGFLGKHIKDRITFDFMPMGTSLLYYPTSTEFNLLDYSSIINYSLKEPKFDYIFNCSIYFKPGEFDKEGASWIYNQTMNTNFLRYIYEFQKQACVITFGTDAAYPTFSDKREEDYLKGVPNKDYYSYALTKRNLYEGLLRIYEDDSFFNFFHFPIITLYGSNYKKEDNHLIHSIFKKVVRGKLFNDEVSFWGTGEQIRECVYVNDLVGNIFYILGMNDVNDFIYNLGSPIKQFKIKDYVQVVCKLVDYDFNKVKFLSSTSRGTYSKTLNSTKAKSEMMFYEDTEFEKSIIKPLEYTFGLYKI